MKRTKGFKILCLFMLIQMFAFSQDFDFYEEIKSSGSMPADFVTLLSEKYKQDQVLIDENNKRRDKKIQKQFYLESNFSMNEIIYTGNVLFNDPISIYLNSIYEKIKLGNSQLNNENIRFYTSKSTIINAFTTHAGIIFFNIGLLAKVQTEDEIAYIMCHEIAHYLKKHNIKQYTFNEELESRGGVFRKYGWEEKMFSKANYSQQHEMEADALGLELYVNTDYNPSASVDALNNLMTYQLPFESSSEFSKSVFEDHLISFDSIYIPPIDSILIKEYENDNELSTHPEIQTRVDTIAKILDKLGIASNKESVTNQIQNVAQFEMCHLYLEKGMFYHAIFCTLALLDKNSSSHYLNTLLCKCMYSLSQCLTFGEYHVK